MGYYVPGSSDARAPAFFFGGLMEALIFIGQLFASLLAVTWLIYGDGLGKVIGAVILYALVTM